MNECEYTESVIIGLGLPIEFSGDLLKSPRKRIGDRSIDVI